MILSSAVADEKLKKLHCQVRFKIHKITINVNPTFYSVSPICRYYDQAYPERKVKIGQKCIGILNLKWINYLFSKLKLLITMVLNLRSVNVYIVRKINLIKARIFQSGGVDKARYILVLLL